MGFLAKAVDYRVDNYLKSSNKVAISEIKAGAQPFTAQHCFGPGIEINPANGENLVISRMKGSSSYMVTIGGTNQKILPDTERGERRIYSVSSDGSTIKAIAKFKNDGFLELNGATDSAVLFAALKTGFDKLVSDFNGFLIHVHGASGTPPVPPAVPSTASVDGSESADIKLS